jgi:predicted nucleotide-binding protein
MARIWLGGILPDGSELQITPAGVEKFKEWEVEDLRWRTGGDVRVAATNIHLRFSDFSLAEALSVSKSPKGLTVSRPKEIVEASVPAQILSSIELHISLVMAVGVLAKWIYDVFKDHHNKSIQINRKTVIVTEAGLSIFIQEQISIEESLQRQQDEMTTNREPTALIGSLLDGVSQLPFGEGAQLDALRRRAKLIITKIFGHTSHYLADLDSIKFHAAAYQQAVKPKMARGSWDRGTAKFKNLCNTMLEDIGLPNAPATTKPRPKSNRVFVVHGHDNEMKEAAARAIEKFSLEAVILHEQRNKGKTVIEKFEHNSNVQFAVVLLSPDDMGYPKDSTPETARPRPRQNVVFELGFFVGKLGRENVFVLHRKADDFEILSDYAGVVYEVFDSAGAWKLKLANELEEVGYDIPKKAFIS